MSNINDVTRVILSINPQAKVTVWEERPPSVDAAGDLHEVSGAFVVWHKNNTEEIPSEAQINEAISNLPPEDNSQALSVQEQIEQLKAAISGDSVALASISAEVAVKK